jgi:hypothetical protein
MTESEWLASIDVVAMLEAVGHATESKLRLFSCACCRRIWRLLTDERSRMAVQFAEEWAHGRETGSNRDRVRNGAAEALRELERRQYNEEFDVFSYTPFFTQTKAEKFASAAALAAVGEQTIEAFDLFVRPVEWKTRLSIDYGASGFARLAVAFEEEYLVGSKWTLMLATADSSQLPDVW